MSAESILLRLHFGSKSRFRLGLLILVLSLGLSTAALQEVSAEEEAASPAARSSEDNNHIGIPDESKLKAKLKHARNGHNKKTETEALNELAAFYNSLKKPEQAIPLYQEALRLLDEQVEDKILEYKTCSSLGDIFYSKERYAEAELLYKRALNCAIDSEQDKSTLARARRDLGNALLSQQKNTDALQAFEQALESAEKEKDVELINDIKLGVANSRWNEGEYAKAREIYEFLLAQAIKEVGQPTASASARTKDIADCNYEEGHTEKALDGYKSFLAMVSKLPEPDQAQVEEAKTRIDELCERLGLPTQKDRLQEAETRKQIDRDYAWLPYGLGAALMALLILYLCKRRSPSKDLADNHISSAG